MLTCPDTLLPWMLLKLLPAPIKKLEVTALPKLALPDVILPVTSKLVKVPTDVIFGCAFVYTVPDTKLLPT